MATKKWTLISQTVTDHIKVPPTATNTNITRLLNNATNDWSSIAKIINKYEIKNGTHNSVIQRIRDIKSGKITELSQITSSGSSSDTSSSADSDSSSSGDTGSSGGSEDTGPLNSTVSKIPITDRAEAMDFAKTEWNKIRRTSGHQLECQVFGSHYWKTGEWCKVYLPSLNEYTDMYITKVDNSNDSGSEWLTNLTLMDYAPSISQLDESTVKKESEDSTGTDGATDGSDDGSAESSKWADIASILQKYYEKPSEGWNGKIQSVREAKKYDPDIRSIINSLTKKEEYKHKSQIDIGYELCDVIGIGH